MGRRYIGFVVMLLVFGIGSGVYFLTGKAPRTRSNSRPPTAAGIPRQPTDTSPDGVFSDLRCRALASASSDFGLASVPADAPVYCVLMEFDDEGETITLLSGADGTTSLYFSDGGGVLGGQSHESVRTATAALLAETNRLRSAFTPTRDVTVPEAGRTIFFAVTPDGVLAGRATTQALEYGTHVLAPLHRAAQDVITAIRLNSKKS